jgi:hypothetical protein
MEPNILSINFLPETFQNISILKPFSDHHRSPTASSCMHVNIVLFTNLPNNLPLVPPCLFNQALKLNVLKCSRSLDGSKLVNSAFILDVGSDSIVSVLFSSVCLFWFRTKDWKPEKEKDQKCINANAIDREEDEDEKIKMLMMMSAENGIECFLRFSFALPRPRHIIEL